ncbi:hypothetical protein CYQ88_04100 [Hydrogenovibrio sp. SC-1]|uniref:hypothetical protein n=1 Tax=Hydrogenovibrio sp. SC-1 TaxID=2065820 RepID=UPI000C7DFB92|nr:hypothetical protein [Hydrogenovibrio sp. SC-1]PLA74778.1 hypothetical protein CYQ88_04100 [Hydrogenovibrio sp. SC-1]
MEMIKLEDMSAFSQLSSNEAEACLYQLLVKNLSRMEQALVPDLSHISHFASYAGDMSLEAVEHIRDNRFRLSYQVPWQMNWSCAGQTESGIANEKIHFTVSEVGQLTFLFLRVDS